MRCRLRRFRDQSDPDAVMLAWPIPESTDAGVKKSTFFVVVEKSTIGFFAKTSKNKVFNFLIYPTQSATSQKSSFRPMAVRHSLKSDHYLEHDTVRAVTVTAVYEHLCDINTLLILSEALARKQYHFTVATEPISLKLNRLWLAQRDKFVRTAEIRLC